MQLMTPREIRILTNGLRRYHIGYYSNNILKDLTERLEYSTKTIEILKEHKSNLNKSSLESYYSLKAMMRIIKNYNLSDAYLNKLVDRRSRRWEQPYKNGITRTVYRDNKEIPNKGSGGSGNYIRYPSKKRSLKTWTNFYTLFPWRAELDGWDGKTSSRYNGANKQKKKKRNR